MRSIIQAFTSWRMAVVLLMGFSSGIPLALTASTLQAWMFEAKVDLGLIGIFSLVGMPYALKFVWAPFMDRFRPPLLSRFWGRRRGWIFAAQVGLVFAIIGMGFSDPVAAPARMAALALLVAFFSASQDIVVDAYRVEVLRPEEYGAGAGVYVMSYRIAMLVSGALALFLADHLPWKTVYLIMASTMGIGIVASVFGPEPKLEATPPKTLREAVVLPFVEYFRRRGAFEMLAFMILYKIDVALTLALTTPFMLDIGFSKTEIAAVTKVFGMIATIVGTLAGGAMMLRISLYRALWIFGIAQALSGLSFTILAHLGKNYPMLVTSIAVENLCSGLGTAAFSAFMMSLVNKSFTATQYALLTSFMALTRYVAGAPSGFLVKAVGWETYFIICTFAGVPGLILLMTRFKRWGKAPLYDSGPRA